MRSQLRWAGLALGLAVLVRPASAAVVEGVWNESFVESYERAQAECKPLVLIWGNEGCTYCNQLWKTVQQAAFKSWMDEHGGFFVHKQDKMTSKDRSLWQEDNRAAADWIDSFSDQTGRTINGPSGSGWPFPVVVVYWPKAEGAPVCSLFTGRGGSMPVKSGTLENQFLRSVDRLIGDYYAPQEMGFGVRTRLIGFEEGVTQAMPFPVDFNGDGLLDLLVGVKIQTGAGTWVGKVRLAANTGTAERPRFVWSGEYLTVNGEELVEHQTAGGCQGLQAQFGDFNGDGYADLAVGHLAGELEVYPGTATPGFYGEKVVLLGTAASGAAQRTYGCFFDADGDGCDELFTGFMDGTLACFDYDGERRLWTTNVVKDAAGNALRLPPQSQENNRRSTPGFLDVDGDGLTDIVSGSTDGGIYYFRATALGQWEAGAVLIVEGEAALERSRLAVGDLDGDGVSDLVVGYSDGSVAWYEGRTRSSHVELHCSPEEAYVPGLAIEPVRVSVTPWKVESTVTAANLPSGLSLVKQEGAYFISGTPKAPYSGKVKLTATYTKGGEARVLTEEVPFKVLAKPLLKLERDGRSTGNGPLNGSGSYLAGQKVTISATPVSNSAFAGWYLDGRPFAGLEADYRKVKMSLLMPTNAETTITARFVLKTEDAAVAIVCEPAAEGYAPNEAMTPLPVRVESFSEPTVTVKGLPKGMKFDASVGAIVGSAATPGTYAVTVTAKNKSGAACSTNVTVVVCNYVDEEIPIADSYGPFVPGLPLEGVVLSGAVGCKVTGLPSGVKFDKATGRLSGTPKKPGASVLTFTKTVSRVNCNRKASTTLVVGPYPVLSVEATGTGVGTVKGAGAYAARAKVALKATAGKGSVFAGWFEGGAILSKSASLSTVMTPEDRRLEARFVTKDEDAASVALQVAGVSLVANETAVSTNFCGVALNWPVAAAAESAVSVKASGLPAGLKLTADKATGQWTLAGAPTAASKLQKDGVTRTPSSVKLTVTTAGKATKTYFLALTVLPRGNWVVGTADGRVRCEAGVGTVTATVAANGKVSGKCLVGTKTYSFSAASLAGGDEESGYFADVDIKIATGVVVRDRLFFGSRLYEESCPDVGTVESGDAANFLVTSNAVQNIWKRADAADFLLPAFEKGTVKEVAYEDAAFGASSLSFKFGAKGAVTVAGSIGGAKVSASAQLLLDDIGMSACKCFNCSFNGRIVVFVKSLGYCRTFDFSGDAEVGAIGANDIVLEAAPGEVSR